MKKIIFQLIIPIIITLICWGFGLLVLVVAGAAGTGGDTGLILPTFFVVIPIIAFVAPYIIFKYSQTVLSSIILYIIFLGIIIIAFNLSFKFLPGGNSFLGSERESRQLEDQLNLQRAREKIVADKVIQDNINYPVDKISFRIEKYVKANVSIPQNQDMHFSFNMPPMSGDGNYLVNFSFFAFGGPYSFHGFPQLYFSQKSGNINFDDLSVRNTAFLLKSDKDGTYHFVAPQIGTKHDVTWLDKVQIEISQLEERNGGLSQDELPIIVKTQLPLNKVVIPD